MIPGETESLFRPAGCGVDARRARRRGGGPGRDAGNHRVASRSAVGGHEGRRIDSSPDRRGPKDLHRRHGRFRNRRRRVRLMDCGPREGPHPSRPGLSDSGLWPSRGPLDRRVVLRQHRGDARGDDPGPQAWVPRRCNHLRRHAPRSRARERHARAAGPDRTSSSRGLRPPLRNPLGDRRRVGGRKSHGRTRTSHQSSPFAPEGASSRERGAVEPSEVPRPPDPVDAIARRWQTQLNENAKVLAFSSTFPEADHNELVGWVEDARARTHRAILLRDRDEAPDLRRQLDITVSLMSRKAKVEQVHDEGPTLVSRMLGTLYLGDYVSLYLAVLRRVDPLVLKPIQTLKAKLAESHRKG